MLALYPGPFFFFGIPSNINLREIFSVESSLVDVLLHTYNSSFVENVDIYT